MKLEKIINFFEAIEDWQEKYQLLIEIGNKMLPLQSWEMSESYKVSGCTSSVWLVPSLLNGVYYFNGSSNAAIVKGLVYLVIQIYSGKTPKEILEFDVESLFEKLNLKNHLSPTRSNGLYSMVEKVKEIVICNHTFSVKEFSEAGLVDRNYICKNCGCKLGNT
jgi:cysteine desulfuration protein SufE